MFFSNCCGGCRRNKNIMANHVRNPLSILGIITFIFFLCGVTFEIIRSFDRKKFEDKMPHTNPERLRRWANAKEREHYPGGLYDDRWHPTSPKKEFGYVCEIPSLHPEDRIPGDKSNKRKYPRPIPVEFNDGHWCPPGWDGPVHRDALKCYKAFPYRVTQEVAIKKCAALNIIEIWKPLLKPCQRRHKKKRRQLKRKLRKMVGRLVQIEDDLENKQVHYTCGGRQSCWIGLKKNDDNAWVWMDDLPLSNFEMFDHAAEDGQTAAYISKGPLEDGMMSEELMEIMEYEAEAMGEFEREDNHEEKKDKKFEPMRRPEYDDPTVAEFNSRWYDGASRDRFPAVCEYLPISTDVNECAPLPEEFYSTPKYLTNTGHCYARINTPMDFFSAKKNMRINRIRSTPRPYSR